MLCAWIGSASECKKKTTPKKDTVTADKQNDKVNAHHHVGEDRPSIRHDAIVHHSIPVFSCQNLERSVIKEEMQSSHEIFDSRSHIEEELSDGDIWGNHLKASEQSLREWVESASLHLSLIKVEFASKQLHAQQGENDEEEEEQEQKGADSFHGVQQWVHQVRQSSPMSANNDNKEGKCWK